MFVSSSTPSNARSFLPTGPASESANYHRRCRRKLASAPSDNSLDLQEQEQAMIERALERFSGNRRQAAEALKISTVTLWRKMKQYGLGA